MQTSTKLPKFIMSYMATGYHWVCCFCAFAVLFRNLSRVRLRTLQSIAR